jgi:hypothetical protein
MATKRKISRPLPTKDTHGRLWIAHYGNVDKAIEAAAERYGDPALLTRIRMAILDIEITATEPGRVVVVVPEGHAYLHATDLVSHLEESGALSVERTGNRTWSLLTPAGKVLEVATRLQKAIDADLYSSVILI